ncbi:MAG: prephenate dehydratase domain-containing protein [Sphingomicrobium sp.]
MSVAYQGVPGAFSHEACRMFLADEEPVGCATFAQVIEAVEMGQADFGMLPRANNSAGTVDEVQQLLDQARVAIVAEHKLPIRIHLLGLPDGKLEQVRTAVSHPMALKQCAGSLAALGLEQQSASNTAAAAQALSDPANAVLASEAAAEAYGLAVLKRDMHDRDDNETTFVIVARQA